VTARWPTLETKRRSERETTRERSIFFPGSVVRLLPHDSGD
jgi:hypothetical protein